MHNNAQSFMNIRQLLRGLTVTISIDKLTKLVQFAIDAASQVVTLKQEIASLKDNLATSLANDAADAQAISEAKTQAEAAKVEADNAKQAIAPLQAVIDADATEDEQVNTLLDSVVIPE